MLNIKKLIIENNLIASGDVVGVACSGGIDSMCLLHYLHANRALFDCEIIAINIDHNIRENSNYDSLFVKEYCKNNNIKCLSFKLDIPKLCADRKIGMEQGAREGRYQTFKKLANERIISKIALGHHVSDQAETILLNIFRGSGIVGARGMEAMRENFYIRPLLTTTKSEVVAYAKKHKIKHVEDESNYENTPARNYLRNIIIPAIKKRWPAVESTLSNFSSACKQDDDFIESTISNQAVIIDNYNTCRVSTSYLSYPKAVAFRILRKACKTIGVFMDIETRHLNIMVGLGLEAENGSRINLPHGLTVLKEYGYITLTNQQVIPQQISLPLKKGKTDIPYFGVLEIVNTRNVDDKNPYTHLVDVKKIPTSAVWRYRKDGDSFEKFGGGTKSLSNYLIDKKIPQRLRNGIPVLACGSEIFIIAGVEISNKVKITKDSKSAWGINVIKFN